MLYPDFRVADPCPDSLTRLPVLSSLRTTLDFFYPLFRCISALSRPPQMWHCLDTLALGPGRQRSTDSDVMLYLKAELMRTGWKGACCGLTSKPVSGTAHGCQSWHRNLCHGQMTAFILSDDRHVILKRFPEQATTFQKVCNMWFYNLTLSSQTLSEFHYCLERLAVISVTKNTFSVRVMV